MRSDATVISVFHLAEGNWLMGFAPHRYSWARSSVKLPILSEKDVISSKPRMLELLCFDQNAICAAFQTLLDLTTPTS